jgi:hypothetical protein
LFFETNKSDQLVAHKFVDPIAHSLCGNAKLARRFRKRAFARDERSEVVQKLDFAESLDGERIRDQHFGAVGQIDDSKVPDDFEW